MSTRATIEFKAGKESFFVYRGHDAFPENVVKDLEALIKKAEGRWSNPELGLMVTLFVAFKFDVNERLPNYEISKGYTGDESYKYLVEWDKTSKQWIISY